jgi:hypothetical protein
MINKTGRGGESIFDPPYLRSRIGMWATRTDSTLAVYRRIRDQIETRVEDLAQRLRDKVNVRQSA